MLLVMFSISSACIGNTPVNQNQVRVTGGVVQGVNENGITVFKGIPFAAPPVGKLRWQPPQPVVPWQGVLQADHFAAACPQLVSGNFASIDNNMGTQSEDCLYLNIWTPALDKGAKAKLPVMVWIHGGGFAFGASSQSNWTGEKLAAKNVVLVSIAYRLGVFGFLAHPELSAENVHKVSGNYGLMDQQAALAWIQKNIAAFGGDPANVTIFGESAGGISVSMLCASPLSKGLFKRAISESGGAFGPVEDKRLLGMQSLKAAEQNGLALAKRLGATNVAALRQVPVKKILQDQGSTMGANWPVCDGYVLLDDATKLYRQGRYNDVDILIGTNSNEGAMFLQNPVHKEDYLQYANLFGTLKSQALTIYPGNTDTEALTSMRNIFMDTVFAWPTYTWARLQSMTGHSKVYVYYFDQTEPAHQTALKFDGAAHSDEINYVFGHVDKNFNFQYTDKDRALSTAVMDYWTNFARTGNPNGNGLPNWPRYEYGKDTVMYLNSGNLKAGSQPNLARMQFMDLFFAKLRSSI